MTKEQIAALQEKLKTDEDLTFDELVYQYVNYAGYNQEAAEERAARYVIHRPRLKIISDKYERGEKLTYEERLFYRMEEHNQPQDLAESMMASIDNKDPNRIVN